MDGTGQVGLVPGLVELGVCGPEKLSYKKIIVVVNLFSCPIGNYGCIFPCFIVSYCEQFYSVLSVF